MIVHSILDKLSLKYPWYIQVEMSNTKWLCRSGAQRAHWTIFRDLGFISIQMAFEALRVDETPWRKWVEWKKRRLKKRLLSLYQLVKEEEGCSYISLARKWGFKRLQETGSIWPTSDVKIKYLILCSGLECQSISKYSFKARFQLKKTSLELLWMWRRLTAWLSH